MQLAPKSRIKFKFRRYHHLAIELRYEGKTYKEISEQLSEVFKVNFRPDRIGHWFASNGILEEPYIDFAKKENERVRRFVSEQLKGLLSRIPEALEGLLNRVDETGNPRRDALTLATIRLLIEIVDLKAYLQPEEEKKSILDEYFERLKQERTDAHEEG